MITLYTSVGRYELRKNENGEKQPIVTVDQKEMEPMVRAILSLEALNALPSASSALTGHKVRWTCTCFCRWQCISSNSSG